jgi:type IV pilus assembly protein PilY1
VDGEVFVSSPSQTPNKNLLVGSLGRGGKVLYGLDVSNPTAFSEGDVKWEISGDNCFDPNPLPKYLGNMIGSFGYSNVNGKPSVIFGNGYNSCNGKAALGIVEIETGNATFIEASNDLFNGLASPAIWNNAAENKGVAYAGDLTGKLWKFNLNQTNSAPSKLFTANANQPITARPFGFIETTDEGKEKAIIYIGTGRYLSSSDKSSTTVQSFYAIFDDGGAASITRSDLQERTFGATTTIAGLPAKTIAPLPNPAIMATKKGWYIDLKDPGERIVSSPVLLRTLDGVVAVAFTTIIPPVGADPCSPKGTSWLYIVDARTGDALNFVLLDINGDGEFNEKDGPASAIKIGEMDVGDGKVGMSGQITISSSGIDSSNERVHIIGIDTGVNADTEKQFCAKPPCNGNKGNTQKGRVSWREISN